MSITGILVLISVASPSRGQINVEKQLEPFKKVGNTQPNDQEQMFQFKEGKYILSKPTADDLAVMQRYAQMLIYKITLPEYHVVDEGVVLKPKDPLKTISYQQAKLKEHLLTPDVYKNQPGGQPTLTQQFYIKLFGDEVDKAIQTILTDKNPPTILRIAALRMLVTASETGAPAHWRTVEKILNDKNPRPDEYYYALKALENLIKTYDPARLTWLPDVKNAAEGEAKIVAIAKKLETIITDGPPLMDQVYISKLGQPALTSDKKDPNALPPSTNTPEHQAVVRFYRLQAIKALSQFKLEVVGGNAVETRPMYTLARVAVNDPTLKVAPTTKEVGEALIGLAMIDAKKFTNAEEWSFALATGIKNFAMPKSSSAADDTVAWKGYGARLQVAMAAWNKGLQGSAGVKKAAGDLVRVCDLDVFNPLQGKPGTLNAQSLNQWLAANPSPTKGELFNDKKALVLTYGK